MLVPVSRCLSATGVRFSVIRFPPGNWALLTVGLPDPKIRTQTGYHVAHAQDATGLGASCTPGAVVLSWPAHITSQRLPLFGGQPLHPVPATLINGVPNDEASTEV